MNTYYINLDAAAARRAYLEENFRRHAPAGAQLVRVPAVDAARVRDMNLAGNIRPTEIACLLSHRNALAASLADEDHSLIVEDDALFGPGTFAALARLPVWNDDSVDLVYTSVMLSDWRMLLQLALWRRALVDKGEFALLDLSATDFCGADAYVVKRHAKPRLLALLNALPRFDLPYDFLLRSLIQAKQLRAVAVFPNVTTLSPLADDSSNGNQRTEWNAVNCLRRLLSLDAPHYPGDIMAPLDAIDPSFVDAEAENFARVARIFLSRRFTPN